MKKSHVRKILMDRRELLETSKQYDDGEYYLWIDENVDEDYPEEYLVSLWLTYHPDDRMVY